ncbi:MAG: GIY-YIG nuclease family protein [Sedimentisphaerales bacterium]|nr:GIY-YIG nuclease family protein [Sedimentisphaerales bacterium]
MGMDLNKLLLDKDIDPRYVLVFRHRPPEPELNKVLPWLAGERPDLFNAYQQTQQGERLEQTMHAMEGTGYVASFIGREAGKALFVGLYSIERSHPLTHGEYWNVPAHIELKSLGMKGFTGEGRPSRLWFDLVLADFCADWKGKLIVSWPPPERSWWRRAHRNDMPVLAILEDSALDAAMPEWDAIDLTWEQLSILPARWRAALSQWRGIYYIFDASDGKGYVGSAYGKDNLLGRWQDYAAHGHGGNRLLRRRDPRNFRFTILQRVSPDMEVDDVIRLEGSWKQRLHTREPYGLNAN